MIWANLILITAWWLLIFQFIQRLLRNKDKKAASRNKKHPDCIVWQRFESEEEFHLICKRESLLFLAIYGQVFDVSAGTRFYGPGGPYSSFIGRDCSVMLAKQLLDPKEAAGLTVQDLSKSEKMVLNDWYQQFQVKYTLVGEIAKKP